MKNIKLHYKPLNTWFLETQRDLPWRNSPTPYAVWVSEVMLQQTQVSVVIPYFLRWMERFPTIEALANASLDEVIKEWEGLGYYSRARNLHAGAKMVLNQFQGEVPKETEQLKQIKGLGPYTIGAIQSFAFHKKVAAVDGNVLRVIARYTLLKEDISKVKTVKQIREWVENNLPDQSHWITNEALIELGATICSKKPACHICPLKQNCRSFAKGCADQLPIKKNQTASIPVYRTVVVIRHHNQLLIKRGEEGKVMHDLHEFPFFENTPSGFTPAEAKEAIHKQLSLKVNYVESLPLIKHTYTKYRVQLQPMVFEIDHPTQIEKHQWMTIPALTKLAFSSGHRKVFDYIQKA